MAQIDANAVIAQKGRTRAERVAERARPQTGGAAGR
jgi:hypothetical protein